MKHKALKIGISTAVLTLAFGGLLWSTLRQDMQYYKHVDEVTASPANWHGKKLQVHGFVRDLHQKPGTLEYVFQVENKGEVLWAQYTGIVPDTFKKDSEVVITGLLRDDGFHVQPDGIMAKCPSKYEAQSAAVGDRAPVY